MRKDLTGCKFGDLTVIRQVESRKRQRFWLCACSCGKTTIVGTGNLTSGKTKSCGHRKSPKKHGKAGTRIYGIYQNMKQRCGNPNNTNYKSYGGRGIKVCRDWQESFESFFEWALSNGYDKNLELDRINVNGDYSPDNCRWITHLEQCQNRRTNVKITINGVTKTLSEWAQETGIPYKTILSRHFHGKKGVKLIEPVKKKRKGGEITHEKQQKVTRVYNCK